MENDKYRSQNVWLKNFVKNSFFPGITKYYKGNGIIDVGSNTGMFIECCLEKFLDTKILAFEPVKRYFDYSVERFKSKQNVIIENFALSDEEKEDDIYIADKNIGWNTLIKEQVNSENINTVEKVKTICFDKYYKENNIGIIDIIKIDTEGFEYKVINGMRDFLKEQKPVIICEVAWGVHHPYWKKELEVFDYLYSIGYDNSQYNFIKGLTKTTDVIFEPIIMKEEV